MIIKCLDCQEYFDDAKCDTGCPHTQFLSDREFAAKDHAISLLGKDVCFAHAPDGERYRIQSIAWDGMITLAGDKMVGLFAPHLFVVAK